MRQLEERVPLAPRSSFRVGGTARWFAEPANRTELLAVLEEARATGRTVTLLGGGTNTLFDDGELESVVVSTKKLQDVEIDPDGRRFECGPGVPTSRAIRTALKMRASGFEGFCGIPGSIGGAVFGNAGGATGGIGQIIDAVEVVEPDGRVHWLDGAEIPWRYRSSGLGDRIIARVRFRLSPGDPDRIRERTLEVFSRKAETQPLSARSAGCVFRNPDGQSAGRLIEEAGLKGLRVGGAVVSPCHANFVVNEEGATAADIRELVSIVRERVFDAAGIRLEREVGGPGWRARETGEGTP